MPPELGFVGDGDWTTQGSRRLVDTNRGIKGCWERSQGTPSYHPVPHSAGGAEVIRNLASDLGLRGCGTRVLRGGLPHTYQLQSFQSVHEV